MNIFVVLLGNAQLSFLMGTMAHQGEKLPLPPCLLCWDAGSHPELQETTTSTQCQATAGLTVPLYGRGPLGDAHFCRHQVFPLG